MSRLVLILFLPKSMKNFLFLDFRKGRNGNEVVAYVCFLFGLQSPLLLSRGRRPPGMTSMSPPPLAARLALSLPPIPTCDGHQANRVRCSRDCCSEDGSSYRDHLTTPNGWVYISFL